MNTGDISTRIPEVFRPSTGITDGDGVYAWTQDGDGNLLPTGNSDLSTGQAWEDDGSGNLIPTGDAITDDPYWTSAGGDDIRPA